MEKHLFIGDVIRKERKALGYTRKQLAARADITVRYLAAIELDEKQPSLDVVNRLVHVLGISAEKLFRQDEKQDEESMRLLRLLRSCSNRDRKLVAAVINTILDARSEETLHF